MNLIRELTDKLIEACRDSNRQEIYGTDWDHIESIVQLPQRLDDGLMFEVTTWHEMSGREVEKMGLVQVMSKLARYISSRASNEAVSLFP